MKITDKYVLFWGGVFSNFEPAPFIYEGNKFLTSEHYFMYCKAIFFEDFDTAKKILQAEHPRDAKKLGRKVSNFNSEKWSEVCEHFMKHGLRLKFGQNPNLLKELLKYPNHTFVEASPYDKIWGIGLSEDDIRAENSNTWNGMNLLGYCLSEIRNEFLENEKYFNK